MQSACGQHAVSLRSIRLSATYRYPKTSLLQEKKEFHKKKQANDEKMHKVRKHWNVVHDNLKSISAMNENEFKEHTDNKTESLAIMREIKMVMQSIQKSIVVEERECLGSVFSVKDHWQFAAEQIDWLMFYFFSTYLITIVILFLLPLLNVE